MKQFFTFIAAVLLTATAWAQSPHKMSYQAVVRDAGSHLVTNTQVGIEINIYQGSATGTQVYTETQTPTTNSNGLLTIEIGGQTGFDTISWAKGPYFLETKIDLQGGTAYSITGVSQLLTVPYALYAKTAETVTSGTTIKHKYYLGQDTLGGIVYHIYLDADGEQHGLIVSKTQSTYFSLSWQNSPTTTHATSTWDGAYNMDLMSNSPAKDWVTSNYTSEWYLPSIDELSLLWHNRYYVNKALNGTTGTLLPTETAYWSSTEFYESNAKIFSFLDGSSGISDKNTKYTVRAIRSF